MHRRQELLLKMRRLLLLVVVVNSVMRLVHHAVGNRLEAREKLRIVHHLLLLLMGMRMVLGTRLERSMLMMNPLRSRRLHSGLDEYQRVLRGDLEGRRRGGWAASGQCLRGSRRVLLLLSVPMALLLRLLLLQVGMILLLLAGGSVGSGLRCLSESRQGDSRQVFCCSRLSSSSSSEGDKLEGRGRLGLLGRRLLLLNAGEGRHPPLAGAVSQTHGRSGRRRRLEVVRRGHGTEIGLRHGHPAVQQSLCNVEPG